MLQLLACPAATQSSAAMGIWRTGTTHSAHPAVPATSQLPGQLLSPPTMTPPPPIIDPRPTKMGSLRVTMPMGRGATPMGGSEMDPPLVTLPIDAALSRRQLPRQLPNRTTHSADPFPPPPRCSSPTESMWSHMGEPTRPAGSLQSCRILVGGPHPTHPTHSSPCISRVRSMRARTGIWLLPHQKRRLMDMDPPPVQALRPPTPGPSMGRRGRGFGITPPKMRKRLSYVSSGMTCSTKATVAGM